MRHTLRYYQKEAKSAIISSWRKGWHSPYVSVMTGLGKSLLLADLTEAAMLKNKRVLQLVPKKELVEQNYKEAWQYIKHGQKPFLANEIGLVCAQLNKKQYHRQATIAMVSSLSANVQKLGEIHMLLIDECHHVKLTNSNNNSTEASQYQRIIEALLKANPKMLIAGFTATPYRLDQGMLHEESDKVKPFFTELCYDTTKDIGKLIELDYLSPLETINTSVHVNLSGIKMSGKDFNQSEAGQRFDAIAEAAVKDMRAIFEQRNIKTAIVFCSTVQNARHVLEAWNSNNSSTSGTSRTMRMVTGETPAKEREQIFNWLKTDTGKRYLVNVNVATEGFNFVELESVVLMRATTSPALMVQMIGRLLRPHYGKIGLLLDYGTNIERLGTIDNIRVKSPGGGGEMPRKECLATIEQLVFKEIDGQQITKLPGEVCMHPNLISAKKCAVCEAEFITDSETGNYTMRTKQQALQAKYTKTYDIERIFFSVDYASDYTTKVIKINFITHGLNSVFDLSLKTKNYNSFNNAKKILIALLTNKANYNNILTEDGELDIDKVIQYANDNMFKQVKQITVNSSGKYKNLAGWVLD